MFADTLQALLLGGGYNTSIVIAGSAALGAAGGAVGVFAMLRGRALVADAIAHATLPGVAAGFILAYLLGFGGRSLGFLLGGAALTALLAVLAIDRIRSTTRLAEDTAVASVLGISFGIGVALLSIAQGLPTAGQAGLDVFLLGSTSGIRRADAIMLAIAAFATLLIVIVFFKELRLVAFDEIFADAHGLGPRRANALLMGLVLAVVVLGLRTVGLVMIVALLVIPPAAARFWSDRLAVIVAVAAAMGAYGAWIGAGLSAGFEGLPTGATIVIVLFALFLFGFVFGTARGVVARMMQQSGRST